MRDRREQVGRPEIVAVPKSGFGVVQKPLTRWENLFGNAAVRKAGLLVLLAAVWEIGARQIDNELVFPSFSATLGAFWSAVRSGILPQHTAYSLRMLLHGYATSLTLATLLTPLTAA